MSTVSKKLTSADSARSTANINIQPADVELAKCECCGLKEECTPAYIARVRDRFYGRWICGLCAEAVKDELCRANRRIGMEDALEAHMAFCMQFNSSARTNPAVHLAAAMRQLLKRSLESPSRSSPSSPRLGEDVGRSGLARSTSCISTLAR
eukprot:Gb_32616 [translate_table: standard]